MNRDRLHLGLLGGLLLLYWTVSVRNLTILPPVYEDEPWQVSTGWKLATEGVFGSDMFAGLYGMERHYYGYMPVHPLLLAAIFRAAGLGLFQARLEPVMMGLLTLALTFSLGRRLFGPEVGLLAVALLILVRLTGLTRFQLTGILFLDVARIARYDMVVPVFGLASLHAYLSGRRSKVGARPQALRRFALAGLLAGLAGLSHLYGAFWLIALGLLALWDGIGRRGLLAMAAGFVAPWLPYLAYVLVGLPDWIGQTRGYAPRFDLLNPRWYWRNVLLESRRYGPGLGPASGDYLLRPGFWSAVIALPLSFLALAERAIRKNDRVARALVVPALLLPALFALLIHLKLANYLVTIIPLWALAGAWGGISLWRRAGRDRGRRWMRAVLLVVLLLIGSEGAARIYRLRAAPGTTTPYADFIAQVHWYILPGSRVLGLQNYWLGLDDLDYRAWPVPLSQANPDYRPVPLTLEEALGNTAPDVILIDPRMRDYFEGAPLAAQTILDWMENEGYVRTVVIEDPTYGRMEVYKNRSEN